MSSLRPDARVRAITASAGAGDPPPEDPLDRAIYLARVADPPEPPDPYVLDALGIYDGPYRHVLDALLLAKAPTEEICAGLDIPEEVLRVYRAACFDVTVFRHVFALRHYVRNLVNDGTDEAKSYDLALSEGYDALLDRYRVTDGPDVDPKRATMRLAREFLLRSREHRGLPITNAVARESLKAAKVALDACAQLHTMMTEKGKGGGSREDLRIALQECELTHAVDAGPVPLAELVRTGPADPAPKRD